MNKIKRGACALLAAGLIAGAAACQSRHTASATSTSVQQVENAGEQMLIKAGVPLHGTPMQQLAFAKSVLGKSTAARANRAALARKLGIPAQNRPAFESGVLGLVEQDHVLTRKGRDRFLLTDLPLLVKEDQ